MKKWVQLIALFIALVMGVGVLSFCLMPVSTASSASLSEEKISAELASKFAQAEDDCTVTAMVWFSDIDLSAAEQAGINAVEAVSAEKEATFNLQAENMQSIEEVQAYIQAKRAATAKLYIAHNQQLAEKLFSENEIVYVSKYSPVVLATLNEDAVLELATSTNVESIELYDVQSFEPADGTTDESTPITLANINQITRASTVNVSSSYGYTGNGVIIGVFDGYLPSEESFSHLDIHYDSNGVVNSTHTHSTIVLEILSSIAPDATYYVTSLASSSTSNALCMERIEWLLDQGVNVINSSIIEGSDGFDTYGEMSKWLDHIAYQHDVHFVQASGNSGGTDNEGSGVQSGGMAYNVITVGNIDANGTLVLSDDEICSSSSYSNTTELANKPDICAPGTGIRTSIHDVTDFYSKATGTSFAAPQVTAAIALLCEQRPALLAAQNTVKAILTASVNFDSPHSYTPDETEYMVYGAGMLDCVGTCWVVGNYRYVTSSIAASTEKTHTFVVGSSDTRIRISLAFNIRSVGSGTNDATITSGTLADLDITIKDPTGNEIVSSTTINNNVEIVDFTPTMTGTYTIVVTRTSTSSETIYYGLAWR